MAQLVATSSQQPARSHFSMDIETFNIADTLNLVGYDATANLSFPCQTSEQVPPQNSSPQSFQYSNPLQSSLPPNSLLPPVYHHVLSASRHSQPMQPVLMSTTLLTIFVTLLSAFTCIDFRSILFSRGTLLVTTAFHAPHTTWNELLKNHLLGQQC